MEARIEFTTGPIVEPVSGDLRETGAEVEFRGMVREMEKGRAIGGLHYEAYEPMARRELERIIAELAKVHHCQSVVFIHRLGWVPVGEASLYVRVQAAHRGPAFHFCAELIDWLKKDVPIWKAAGEG